MAYDLPTPATTKMVYPIVAGVDDATLQFWLDRVVGKDVDQSWPESLGPDAQMAAAVHRLIRAGTAGVSNAAVSAAAAAGLTRWRSGSADLQFSEAAIAQAIAGGWASTPAGQDYWELLQKFASGPRVTAPGHIPFCNAGFNGFAGPRPGWLY